LLNFEFLKFMRQIINKLGSMTQQKRRRLGQNEVN
jgi:hypothetical protein